MKANVSEANLKEAKRVRQEINRLERQLGELELDCSVQGLTAIAPVPEFSPVTVLGIKPNGGVRVLVAREDGAPYTRSFLKWSDLFEASEENLALVEQIRRKRLNAEILNEEADSLEDDLKRLSKPLVEAYHKSKKEAEGLRK
jgi:hypothetical protein